MKKIIYLLFVLAATLGSAQWTDNYSVNTLVATGSTDDIQSVGTIDGKTYVVYWDTTSGYTLRIQLLNADGTKAFGDNGILANAVAQNSTYTVTRDQAVDNNNNLYIAFTATEDGNGYVNKISPTGEQLFGANGISFPGAYDMKIIPSNDGGAYVGWYVNGRGNLMKYDSTGAAEWDESIEITSPNTASPFTSVGEMSVLSDNSVVVLFHVRNVAWTLNSIFWAQRYSEDGVEMWSEPVQISNQTTAYNRRYQVIKDGDVTYLGYFGSTGNRFDSFLQRINADGNLPWNIDGRDVRVDHNFFEMTTSIAVDGDYVWASAQVCNSNQSQYGQSLQKFNKNTGERLLTENGVDVFPVSTANKIQVGNLQMVASHPLLLFSSDISNGVNPIQLGVVAMTPEGNFYWDEETRMIATSSGNKGRIDFTQNVDGQSVAVWTEPRTGASQAFAQNFVLDIDNDPDPGEGCFNTGQFDQWPTATYTPSCTGAIENITTSGWAGEFSKVNVTAGTEYTFSSSISTDFITIAKENEDVVIITGTGSVTWTPTQNGVIRFFTHLDDDCTIEEISRARRVQCGDILPPPANDSCDNAITLACGDSDSGSTVFATDSGGNPANDVFYKYTGTGEAQLVTVSLCGSSFDTYLRVFTDCTLTTEVAYNDDACGVQSELSFVSDGTSTYYIMVEGYGSNSGNFTIDLTCAEPPAFTCEENFVASNNFENGLFLGGDTNQRLAVDIIVGDSGFTVYGLKANLFVDGNTDLTFNVTFYNDEAGLPGTEFHTTTATIHSTTSFGNVFGFDIYEFTLNFAENAVLNANSVYWMEIETNALAWESTTANFLGAGLSFNNMSTSGAWVNDPTEDLVYELVCEDLGISDLNAFNFAYYPNPVKDILNISSKKGVENVSIFNLAGQQILNGTKVNNGQVDMSTLSAGTYVFRVTLEGGLIETFKVVKK